MASLSWTAFLFPFANTFPHSSPLRQDTSPETRSPARRTRDLGVPIHRGPVQHLSRHSVGVASLERTYWSLFRKGHTPLECVSHWSLRSCCFFRVASRQSTQVLHIMFKSHNNSVLLKIQYSSAPKSLSFVDYRNIGGLSKSGFCHHIPGSSLSWPWWMKYKLRSRHTVALFLLFLPMFSQSTTFPAPFILGNFCSSFHAPMSR